MRDLLEKLESQNKLLTEVNKSYNNKLMCLGYQMALDDIRAHLDSQINVDFVELPHFDSEGTYIER